MLSVSELILSGYRLAEMKQEAVARSWITGSHRLGGALPGSPLVSSLQRVGRLDAVLRCMEDEFANGTLGEDVRPWVAEPLVSLSETWVGQVYEIVRLTRERKLIADCDLLEVLAHDLRLLRVPMEKYEIAADRKLMAPLSMLRYPAMEGDAVYSYNKGDSLRAHIMPSGISQRGSVQWSAIDISAELSERWIERRDLSDRVLQLLRGSKATGGAAAEGG